MKQGRYFRIPESPEDIEQLWNESPPLSTDELPTWLKVEDASDYRCVAQGSCAGVAEYSTRDYCAELDQLKAVGLIAYPAPMQGLAHRIFLDRNRNDKYDALWAIGIYAGESPLQLRPAPGARNPVLTRSDVTDVPAVFVADPFLLRTSGVWHMFFEVLNWRSDKGEIGLATCADGYSWSYRQIVLAEPFHLSYPYVFEWNAEYYLIPECGTTGSVRLYRATQFPANWTLVQILLTGRAFLDPSIFHFQGRWWLFAETSPEGKHNQLRLFFSENLMGPWKEHPRSPLLEGNARTARPAGRVMVLGEKPLRFAQDCHAAYGTCVRVMEVTNLTPDSYDEKELAESPVLGPGMESWNSGGMHHIDAYPLGDRSWIAAVDGWTKRSTKR
jgi:hypothetical protein